MAGELRVDEITDEAGTGSPNFVNGVDAAEFKATGTGANIMPVGTTAQRPASPVNGMMRFNTDLDLLEEYRNGEWQGLSNVFSAEGGTVTTAGGFKIHTFTSSGTFNVLSGTNSVEYLVVAGGGGGGSGTAGGGGAGGYRSSVASEFSGGGLTAESPLTLSSGSHVVTVGAGGVGGVAGGSVLPTNGANSVFSSTVSIGGGAGGDGAGSGARPAGQNGGSGGGGWNYVGVIKAPGSGTAGQGFAGGVASTEGGGGGGGAAAAGGAGGAGIGGAGRASSITGSSISRAGGGGGPIGGAGGAGGDGGGGAGAPDGSSNGFSGAVNTGGGGGGSWSYSIGNGGSGGSGIVIIRYAI